ncbi:hypothetical protein [Streptomyces sp. NPDC006631]|uniref:hypothetical protein n=1 Tax=Streptomyces sp. NPDC006631 TaxID=3364752 RepID=UPI0036B199A9
MATQVTRYMLNSDSGTAGVLNSSVRQMNDFIAEFSLNFTVDFAVHRWTCIELDAEVAVVAFYAWWNDEKTGTRAGETLTDVFVKVTDLCTCCEHEYDYDANESVVGV